ncbi:GspH/FimT family pseudopilin [Comamonas endophytica]|uniref:Type II secretion system protein H n=1 Tax=Comamonas endophytica TaxID=2949090 RepID=A0ABY6G715_9BURK|nr:MULTISPECIES: GspH/FimT family pseudopilin [unclassified Acidovorax]MCD2511426.1 GspH/FimT family pseudopilin [Acidovorax sp. D4N7]UYG50817.1 GspH/FimT family pseudopilin [Acidovorax sp. 5MLIR]
MKRPTSRGLTLIEILVVVAIVAIVSALAAPDLSALIKSNRVAGKINALNADISFAKTEAIKRGVAVTLCASADQLTCSPSSDLAQGWIVFADPDENQAIGIGEAIIKVQDKLKGDDRIVLSESQTTVSFNRNGYIYNLPSSGMQVIKVTTSDSDQRSQRCLTFQRIGQAKVTKGGEQTCA